MIVIVSIFFFTIRLICAFYCWILSKIEKYTVERDISQVANNFVLSVMYI